MVLNFNLLWNYLRFYNQFHSKIISGGFREDDELVAVNGHKLSANLFKQALNLLESTMDDKSTVIIKLLSLLMKEYE
jgi:hypothetical protein